jgi:hypothetical protein
MIIDRYPSRQRHTIVNIKRKRLSGFFAQHKLFPIFDFQLPIVQKCFQSAINNWKSAMSEWLTDPGCSLSTEATPTSSGNPFRLERAMLQRVLLATFSIRPVMPLRKP